MLNETTPVTDHHHVHCFHRISWTAIFVGALVGIGLGFLLNLFGIAIGLTAVNATGTGAAAIAIGGLIGLLIGVVVAMMAAGYTAGYLGRMPGRICCTSIIYGFTTWTVALLLGAVFSAHVSNHVAAYSNAVTGSTVTVYEIAGQNVSQKAQEKLPAANQQAVREAASPENMAWAAFTLFVLFFIGAISCCIGAYWAMKKDHVE